MRRLSPRLALLSAVLLCACGQAMATESRHMGPDGGGSCPDSTAAASTDRSDVDTDNDTVAVPVRHTQKAKPATTSRSVGGGGSETRSSAPRWHSFLPGMIR